MCGFLGGVNIDASRVGIAKGALIHRGPDESNGYYVEELYLFHSRLCVLDRAHGKQPMSSGRYTLVFNGQIYNHLELRRKHKLTCLTASDTETLICLYEKLGREMLVELDGMFAFALHDSQTGTIFISRDRAGEKPLYYYHDRNSFAFSSELNSLAALVSPETDYSVFNQYLLFGFIGNTTPYKNLRELGAGMWIEYCIYDNNIRQNRWWNIKDYYSNNELFSLPDAVNKTDMLLRESVKSRLNNSDLEVGTFLSGGVDSGIVTAIASELKPGIKTFTVSFDGQVDETPYAEMVAKRYGTTHTSINIAFDDLKSNVEKIVSNYGEPFSDSSAIPSFYVSREAKKHLTVILNGDGADELFGGYRRYVPFSKIDLFKTSSVFKTFASFISRLLPLPESRRNLYEFAYRLISLSGSQPLSTYLASTYDYFDGIENALILSDIKLDSMESELKDLNSTNWSGLRKIMLLDFVYQFSTHLTTKMDIAAMANSLETRAPFLSREILQFAPSLSDNLKIRNTTTKYLLRVLAEKYLPGKNAWLPKRGFEVPLRRWIEYELKELWMDYLNPAAATFSANFVQKGFLNDLISNKVKIYPEKRAKLIWLLLCLEIWNRKCRV